MMELMNMAVLEVNARRRVEVIAREMRDARPRDRETAKATDLRTGVTPARAPRVGRAAGCREPLTGA